MSTFFFFAFFKETNIIPKYEMCCQAVGFSTPRFLDFLVALDGSYDGESALFVYIIVKNKTK